MFLSTSFPQIHLQCVQHPGVSGHDVSSDLGGSRLWHSHPCLTSQGAPGAWHWYEVFTDSRSSGGRYCVAGGHRGQYCSVSRMRRRKQEKQDAIVENVKQHFINNRLLMKTNYLDYLIFNSFSFCQKICNKNVSFVWEIVLYFFRQKKQPHNPFV